MSTLTLTLGDLEAALIDAANPERPAGPPYLWVEDADTGERRGYIRDWNTGRNHFEWKSWRGSGWGYAESREQALERLAEYLLGARAEADRMNAEWEAVQALPEPRRSAYINLCTARVNVEIERCRNIRRYDDLARAETALREAELAHAAAVRGVEIAA